MANAPDGPCVTGQRTKPPAPFTGWTYNNVTNTTCQNVNNWPSPAPTQPPFPITQAVRVNAFGGGGSSNVATIKSLNQSVRGVLPAGSVWRNYFLVGAVWTKGGALPATSTNEVGSVSLSNATLETFTQATPPQQGNCFGCHNAASTFTFKVSHAFFQAGAGTCPYTSQLPAQCQATQR